jgi:hypothetical protein
MVALVLVPAAGLQARADTPPAQAAPPADASGGAPDDEPKSLPQDGLFSSIKQSLRESDQEIVRGHFDVGSPPNVHRYYCLMDPKSRRREPNGVLGDLIARSDGMTGIKSSAVSLYRCDKAEQQGMLIVAGYLVPARTGVTAAAATAAPAPTVAPPSTAATAAPREIAASAAPPPTAQLTAQSTATAAMATAAPAPAAAPAAISRFPTGMIDVSGVKLGMSPGEVHTVLSSKNLRNLHEWSENLSYRDAATGKMLAIANGRFVNVIAASNSASPAADTGYERDGESFEVMFTPTPGHERVMAIVHTVGYSAANAVHESALEAGLIDKYGGFAAGDSLPQSATWLYQPGGTVTVGDRCGRRGVLGGLGALRISSARENISLEKSPDELGFEVQHCGVAVVTEDHHTADGGALREDRMVTRYTVTAYSPTLAAEGASQAEAMLRAAGHPRDHALATPVRDSHAPDL